MWPPREVEQGMGHCGGCRWGWQQGAGGVTLGVNGHLLHCVRCEVVWSVKCWEWDTLDSSCGAEMSAHGTRTGCGGAQC